MQKKVAFITIHVGANFGSILQAIATSELLKQIGCEPVCVNYIPPRASSKRFWSFGHGSAIKKFLLFFWKVYALPLKLINNRVYQGFLKKNCALSNPIHAEDSFVKECPEADVYMTGSDQVWNIKHNEGIDTHYFFDGIRGKKISFASSIGNVALSDEEKSVFKKYLTLYSSLSVRESTAVSLLDELGFKAVQLLDPTFLIDKEEWKNYMPINRLVRRPYLLIYTPYNTVNKDVIFRHARMIADKEGLQVVTFSWTYYKEKDADKTIRYAGPGDFLNLMSNAEYVITNSFHGTAFSINLNKVFWVFMPSSFTTRISSVLEKFGLSDRLVAGDRIKKGWDYKLPIDYDSVNSVLQVEREKTLQYLMSAIE